MKAGGVGFWSRLRERLAHEVESGLGIRNGPVEACGIYLVTADFAAPVAGFELAPLVPELKHEGLVRYRREGNASCGRHGGDFTRHGAPNCLAPVEWKWWRSPEAITESSL